MSTTEADGSGSGSGDALAVAVRARRRQLRLRQAELDDLAGVSERFGYALEHGKSPCSSTRPSRCWRPSAFTSSSLAAALGTSKPRRLPLIASVRPLLVPEPAT